MNTCEPMLTGQLLAGRYRILSVIGRGGMSNVYLAEDTKLPGKRWAVKESRKHSGHKKLFHEEAALLIRLDHPFLPKIVDFFPPNEEGLSYLVTDYIHGETLQQRFQRVGALPYNDVIKYAVQLCELFDYLHHFKPRPIIYRDLKPSNVMIDEQNNVRLIDFGIARKYNAERTADTIQLGTIGFAAPEQFLNRQTDERTDLYTLGAMMYYLLSGGKYYSIDARDRAVRELPKNLPASLTHVMFRLLADQPDERIQTALEVKRLLQEGMELPDNQRPMNGHSPGDKHPDKRKLVVIGGLYPGAGATFVAVSLARLLHDSKIPHALIEHSGNSPELHSLLFGERNAPQEYRYYTQQDFMTERSTGMRWQDGYTEWLPLPPERMSERVWTADHYFRLLYLLDYPAVLLDVSSQWGDPTVQEMCREADHVIIVADPYPSKLNMPQTQASLRFISGLSNKEVHWIANRDESFSGRREWLGTFPRQPVCLPAYAGKHLLDSHWKGRIAQDHPGILDSLRQHCGSLVSAICHPGDRSERKLGKWLVKWFK
ncbi:serine/threonine-protein kinase [Paenibacillus sp. 32O-W]|uniref:serine/threonine protein kinase n=1 Tax=Paenibacillus sp. 32O-W TaxID=1695218 RepID=UPI0011A4426E|nr:serine/threonine-protein kinase [Paenibacillus sp. 32O-W]